MTLFDRGEFGLDDRVKKFFRAFAGDGRDDVTIRHLLTHTSGLPDQLAENNENLCQTRWPSGVHARRRNGRG